METHDPNLNNLVNKLEDAEKLLTRIAKRKFGAHPDIPRCDYDDVLQTVRIKVWRSLYSGKVKHVGKTWLEKAVDWCIGDFKRDKDPLNRYTRDKVDTFVQEREFWENQGLQVEEIIEAMGLSYQEFVELQSLQQLECQAFSQFEREDDDDTSPIWEIAHRHFDTNPLKELAQELLDCLSRAEDKKLMRQLHWDGLKQNEIARQWEVSPSTITRDKKRVEQEIRSEYEIRSKIVN